METDVVFTRSSSGAEVIDRLIRSASRSVMAALYRFHSPQLASALKDAGEKGASVRICLNNNDHYDENRAAQATLAGLGLSFRLLSGKAGNGSKMHHKFLVIDGRTTVTGSYNWTPESESRNYENLIVLHDLRLAAAYSEEFEALWNEGGLPPAASLRP
ncbi:MAG TPA: phospholipase D-like domain-containing protein [Terriglobia bacterium]|nr:phospholipase D-like domain-containing protein [Terriglobia bacterium]